MPSKYPEYKNLNLPELSKEILSFWEKERAFETSVSLRKEENAKPFVFYEGPPSANGLPGIHHVMSRTIKDIFCRYKTMQGFYVERKAGWDTHGLPVEIAVEKILGITKEDIGKPKEQGGISIEDYNKACRREVMKYKEKWDDLTCKMGYWLDLENPYITYDNSYIESVWWILKNLYDKGLLYKGYTIQPYSPAAGTGLSSHELNLPGCYKMVKDTTVVAQFKVVRNEKSEFLFHTVDTDLFFLAWTTTPWTLPSNTALAVGKDIRYVKIRTINPYTKQLITVILAKDLLLEYFPLSNTGEQDLSDDSEDSWEREVNDFISGRSKNLPAHQLNAHKNLVQQQFITTEEKIDYVKYLKGSELSGIQYEQLLPYVQPKDGDAFRVVVGDFVSTEEGTGIVHIAPSFGADDFRTAKQYGLGSLTLVDEEGKFTNEMGEFAGRYVKNYKDDPNWHDVDVDIAVKLKKENKAFRIEKYEHTYPHCWRTDKPILYYPLDSWFVKVTARKERMVELNKTINWKPAHTGSGRFGDWLNNLQDWNLSRSRFWGIPLPVWRHQLLTGDIEDEICIGSIRELKGTISKKGKKCTGYYFEKDPDYKWRGDDYRQPTGLENVEEVKNLLRPVDDKFLENLDSHKPYVDRIIFLEDNFFEKVNSQYCAVFYREPDLIDVWFDSGAMPFAQHHYPFENVNKFPPYGGGKGGLGAFPADFIAEGVDQTRGWFYTLHAIAAMVFDSVAYKTVVSNGLVLDKEGNKMSKRLGNVVDPYKLIEKYGADAVRWYLITNAQPWDNLKFDETGIPEVQKKFFRALYNTYAFFALYANIDGFTYSEPEVPVGERQEIDRWVISKLNSLVNEVAGYYDDFEPTRAGRAMENFTVEDLSNWYVRLCRRRFWKGEYSKDKIAAFQTLYRCLDTLARLAAPLAPFFSENIFKNLNSISGKEPHASVHHCRFPVFYENETDSALEERMALSQQITSMVFALRKKVNIRVRQPLSKMLIAVNDKNIISKIESVRGLILSEVNVKILEFADGTAGLVVKKIKPNFKSLGPKYGKDMQVIASAINKLTTTEINDLEIAGSINVRIKNKDVTLLAEDVIITSEDLPGWQVSGEGNITVALDVNVTQQLKDEGIAREIINRVQNLRKANDFAVTDRILLTIQEKDEIRTSVLANLAYICNETLAVSLTMEKDVDGKGEEVEIAEGVNVRIIIQKATL